MEMKKWYVLYGYLIFNIRILYVYVIYVYYVKYLNIDIYINIQKY